MHAEIRVNIAGEEKVTNKKETVEEVDIGWCGVRYGCV
jgi:hypothetical protein